MASIEQIIPCIEEKVRSLGLTLFDVKFFRAGKRSILRVFVDTPDGGVTIDQCEEASHNISMILDVEEFSRQPYTLEVSSPGVDWPLKRCRDFLRVAGKVVSVRLREPFEETTSLKGCVHGCDEEAVTLLVDGEEKRVPLSIIENGKVAISFK